MDGRTPQKNRAPPPTPPIITALPPSTSCIAAAAVPDPDQYPAPISEPQGGTSGAWHQQTGCGLDHNRNLCYINAALQLLMTPHPVRTFLLSRTDFWGDYCRSHLLGLPEAATQNVQLNAWWNARYPEGEQGDPGEFIGAALDAWAEGGARGLYRQTFRQYLYQQDTLLSSTPRFVNCINMWIPPDPSPQGYDLGDLYT